MFGSLRQFACGISFSSSRFTITKFTAVSIVTTLLTSSILADSDAQARALHDGVVLSPENGVVYLMVPGGGIDGVDLETGAVEWRTTEAAKPLALAGDLLLAQAEPEIKGSLPLATLDTRKAGAVEAMIRIPLPKGLRARIDDGLGKSFRSWANAEGATASVSWSSFTEPPSGTSPDVLNPAVAPLMDGTATAAAQERAHPSVRHEGVVHLDLLSGRVEQALITKKQAPQPHSLLELTAEKGLQAEAGRQFLSIDGRHVLVSRRQAESRMEERYRWTIFERASGERLGQIENRASAAPFFVWESALIYTSSPVSYRLEDQWIDQGLNLRSVDLVSGIERWSHALRDTEYRGPFPQ